MDKMQPMSHGKFLRMLFFFFQNQEIDTKVVLVM